MKRENGQQGRLLKKDGQHEEVFHRRNRQNDGRERTYAALLDQRGPDRRKSDMISGESA